VARHSLRRTEDPLSPGSTAACTCIRCRWIIILYDNNNNSNLPTHRQTGFRRTRSHRHYFTHTVVVVSESWLQQRLVRYYNSNRLRGGFVRRSLCVDNRYLVCRSVTPRHPTTHRLGRVCNKRAIQ